MAAPVRMCRVCRKRLPKSQLERWVLREGLLVADPAAIAIGRGYYTDSPECRSRLPKVLQLKDSE